MAKSCLKESAKTRSIVEDLRSPVKARWMGRTGEEDPTNSWRRADSLTVDSEDTNVARGIPKTKHKK